MNDRPTQGVMLTVGAVLIVCIMILVTAQVAEDVGQRTGHQRGFQEGYAAGRAEAEPEWSRAAGARVDTLAARLAVYIDSIPKTCTRKRHRH